MQLIAIARHPVKSLHGESLAEAELEADGLSGDRCFGIRDDANGKILTGRREPALLMASSRLTSDSQLEITLPDGEIVVGEGPETNAALSRWLGRPVSLVDARKVPPGELEMFQDPLDDSRDILSWSMPGGRYVDALPLLVVTTASLRHGASLYAEGNWDPRRFRPNLLIEAPGEGWIEDGWCGQVLTFGATAIQLVQPCERCTMVTRAQDGLDRDLDIYRTLLRHHDGTFGVWAKINSTGTIRVGDEVELRAA
jgi:uncharacterized protein